MKKLKIISWNVNGIRAASTKGFLEWLSYESPDVVCLQEVKALETDLDPLLLKPFGYQSYWSSAEKKGYSGVATYTKVSPLGVTRGMGIPEFDSEGRTIVTEFEKFYLINAYFPNSQRDHARLGYKLKFCDAMLKFCQKLSKKKHVTICGDFNIAHKEIDLRNPKTNRDTAGFLPEERAWLDKFVSAGFVDTFREFCNEPNNYTWWSYRPGVREKNIGWRIDYHFVNKNFAPHVKSAFIQPEVKGSDHCPVGIEISF